jgi:hypothetical protein
MIDRAALPRRRCQTGVGGHLPAVVELAKRALRSEDGGGLGPNRTSMASDEAALSLAGVPPRRSSISRLNGAIGEACGITGKVDGTVPVFFA